MLAIFNATLLLSMPGGSEWILIIAVVLLMFGGKKIPELMRGLGRGVREFKDAKDHVRSEIEQGMATPAPSPEAAVNPMINTKL